MTYSPTLGASPIQARSLSRVQKILDAAASIIDRDGVDALTPTEIAYLSGSSVPSVYRYFPNTRSILHALATRNLERFLARVELGSELASDTPWSSLENTLSVFEDMYRSEPSFRSLRFGDGVDPSFLTSEEPNMTIIAKALSAMFAETHDVDMTPDMLHHIEVATTSHSALVDLAFQKDRDGDKELLARAMELTLEYLPKHVPLERPVSS
jgi:AcrR family transcriptional regulator